MIYGYARISNRIQNIERQVRNIEKEYPTAIIIKEVFTGTKYQERKQLVNLVSKVKAGDTIVFDSVSRMSRNAEEGYSLYMELLGKGVELVFLKEQHINTQTYKDSLGSVSIPNNNNDEILDLTTNYINNIISVIAKKQIQIAFNQSEKEVMDLRQRTKEGLAVAKLAGKRVGNTTGTKLTTKKSISAKIEIAKYLEKGYKDVEIMKLTGLARNTYYKYKKEINQ